MVRTVLEYVYLGLGTGLAFVFEQAAWHGARERADTDDDGEAERNVSAVKHHEEQHMRRRDGRSPKEAAAYHAETLVQRPLRTGGLLVAYELLFVGLGVVAGYPDLVGSIAGSTVGSIAAILSGAVASAVPGALLFLLPIVGIVLGAVFTFVVHPSYKTAVDIRRGWA